ncbi:phage antirepressor KilAC domain-containing protein [Pseudomonas sp. Teo4]|uniref:phage antirepressor KilAC domain-containing protein n=1 Tax=Pseudomonas sp. Teo4 TaxID=3064528 RepID=UPI002ABC8DA5|nr:phage antirepressor KilAC domain-containing protein [Pseudomonas sp. Teo4]MDZ3993078.1 hypothetical protein [Pseudomonas sp. Teo4]
MQTNTFPEQSQIVNPITTSNFMAFDTPLQTLTVDYDNHTINPIAMSSMEIADLVGSRHDNVKISIERLVDRGVIEAPALQDLRTLSGQASKEYIFAGEQGKRDSIVVVAQLSPEFTATLVDRWRELEAEKKHDSLAMPNNLSGALNLACMLAYKVEALEQQATENLDKLEFYEEMVNTTQLFSVSTVAKTQDTGPIRLFAYMRDHKILMSKRYKFNEPYQVHLDAGRFHVRWAHYKDELTGEIELKATPYFTGKGVTWIKQFIAKHGRDGL